MPNSSHPTPGPVHPCERVPWKSPFPLTADTRRLAATTGARSRRRQLSAIIVGQRAALTPGYAGCAPFAATTGIFLASYRAGGGRPAPAAPAALGPRRRHPRGRQGPGGRPGPGGWANTAQQHRDRAPSYYYATGPINGSFRSNGACDHPGEYVRQRRNRTARRAEA